MPIIPVDVVAVGILHAMITPPVQKKTEEGRTVVFATSFRNLIWSHKSERQFMDGMTMAYENICCAVLMSHFSAIEATVSLLLLDIACMFPQTFRFFHSVFNLGPLYLLEFICWTLKVLRIKSVLDQVPVVKLFKFSDMLMLYKPFMGNEFKFQSSIHVPPTLNLHRYSASLFVATHGFWTKMFPGTVNDIDKVEMLPKGRMDLCWALTHPASSFENRLVGYLVCQILRTVCTNLELDFTSIQETAEAMEELEEAQNHCVVLAPNHKSVIDFLLAKYTAFFLASLGLDVPTVLAKPEFSDPQLSKKLSKVKSKYDRHVTLAAFLEESPSVDGKIKKPRSEVLEKLRNSEAFDDITLLPLLMDYNPANDSEILLQATKDSSDLGLLDLVSLYWQICILKNAKASVLGEARVAFGIPR
jgi:hypothetical protein